MKTIVIDDKFINLDNVSVVSFKEGRIYISFNDNASTSDASTSYANMSFKLNNIELVKEGYLNFLQTTKKVLIILT